MKIALPTIEFAELVNRYDVFFLDQFGVLRDDIRPYPGAADALCALKERGKTVAILSNSGRSSDFNAKRFVGLGFDANSFDHFITSGEVAFSILAQAVASGAIRRSFVISSDGDDEVSRRLGLEAAGIAVDADVVIISGSQAERISLDQYRDMLRPAAERNLPCYCTNPDLHKLVQGGLAPGAGMIAGLYEELGGKVIRIGKPYPEIYAFALSKVEGRGKVVCVGDSLDHDIVGATTAGLDSVLVLTGLQQDVTEQTITANSARLGVQPTFLMRRFAR